MIFRSPYPDVQVPNVPLTPFVLRHATRLADKPAIIDGLTGQGFTYGELAAAVRTVASALAERGLGKGDGLAIYAANSPEYAIAFHAVVSLGGIVTTVNPAATSEELAYQLNDAGATYLLTASESFDRAVAAAAQAPVRELYCFRRRPGIHVVLRASPRRRRPTRRPDPPERRCGGTPLLERNNRAAKRRHADPCQPGSQRRATRGE